MRSLTQALALCLALCLCSFAAEKAPPAPPDNPPEKDAAKDQPAGDGQSQDSESGGEPSDADAPEEGDAEAADTPIVELPVDIEADKVEAGDETFVLEGNVVVVRGGIRITCDRMDGQFAEAEIVDPETKEKTRKRTIVSLVAVGNVTLTDTQSKRHATCHEAQYDFVKEYIVMTGSDDQRPRITEGDTTTEADQIIIPRQKGKVLLKGRTKTILSGGVPDDEKKDDEKNDGGPGSMLDGPVEIESDYADATKDRFIFDGNVIITRGGTNIKCDRVNGKFGQVETIDPETNEKKSRREIVSLVAGGSVVLTDLETGRRATCQQAEYDFVREHVVMTGSDGQRPYITERGTTTEADQIIIPLREGPAVFTGRTKIRLAGGIIPGGLSGSGDSKSE